MHNTDHRAETARLLTLVTTATAANSDGENPEGALLIAEAQVHATLALAQSLTPTTPEPAKPTGPWVYRVTVDTYPTPDGCPFADQTADYWAEIVDAHANGGDTPDWVPDDLENWLSDPDAWATGLPGKRGRTVVDDDGPLLVVPTQPTRRHWLSKATALSIARDLAHWGATVRLERAPFHAWETVNL